MSHLRSASLFLLLLCTFANAQTGAPSAAKPTRESVAPREIDPEIQQRRSIALSALQSLAIEARSYRDEPLRARVQARVADALWDQDKEGSRSLFRRAWDVAEGLETGTAAATASAPGRLAQNRPARPRANLRREILQLAAHRDRVLGEEFLRRMNAKDQAAQSNDATANGSQMSAAETAERLNLARSFLTAGEVERALQFADPALIRTTDAAISFLTSLREKAPAAADQFFARLLAAAAADPASDANTVSLLTTYAFTPSIHLVVSPNGFPSSIASPPVPPPDLAPALRKTYFQVSANLLLRPLAQIDQSSAGRSGTYFIATRLFPLFQQFAPELAPAISAQMVALGPEAAQATANAGERSVNRGMDNGKRDSYEDELKDRLDRAQGSDARDRAYAFAAMRAAEEGDQRAREFLDKIDDLDTRAGVRRFVDYNFIRSLLQQKHADEALALIRKAELNHTLRAHFITQAAALLADKDRVRAIDLLDEALTETRRIDAGTADRAYCLAALLAQFSKLDKVRSWQLLSETVKAANAVADFTGDNGRTSQLLEGKFSINMTTELASPTALTDLFGGLAEDNFYQAIDAARTFSGEAPRAMVMISVTRSVFEEKRNKSVKPAAQ
ncbi:MAG TPA: hypothetical protein DC054_00460 [Blastocatellia bacterium]|nr:hypothetical protein [Blastocatellia bacterium]